MQKNRKTIIVDEEVHSLITEDCLKELLEHHPELMKTRISINKILYNVCKYYIK